MKKTIFFVASMIFATSANAQNLESGKEFVDLGLSVMWATCNLGATTPDGYGDYFYATQGTDPAADQWGGKWRLPTKEELQELIKDCQWEAAGGGCNITGKNGESIFLPDAGMGMDDQYDVWDDGTTGYYMSSTFQGGQVSYLNTFPNPNLQLLPNYINCISIRPVFTPDPTGLKSIKKETEFTKTFENGQIVIIKNGVKYNIAGQKL